MVIDKTLPYQFLDETIGINIEIISNDGLLTPGCAYNIMVFAARRKVKKMSKKERYVWEGY
jgi:hypothetical protein